MTVLTAAHAFRNHAAFRNTSLRHLTDMIELARGDAKFLAVDTTEVISAAFLLVLSGSAFAERTFPLVPGEVFWTGLVPIFRLISLIRPTTATMMTPSRLPRLAGKLFTLSNEPVGVRGTAAEGTLLLPVKLEVLERATRASTSFALSVDLRPLLRRRWTLHQFFTDRYGRA